MKSMLPAFVKNLFRGSSEAKHVGIAIYSDVFTVMVLRNDAGQMIQDESFEVKFAGEETLAAKLAEVIEEKSLQRSSLSIVLPSHRIQTSQIEKEDLPDTQDQEALPWTLKDFISIPPQDMVCDYIDMPLQPFGQKPKAQVFATSRSYLENLLSQLHESNVTITDILTEQFALARLQTSKDAAQLVFIQHEEGEGTLLILKNQQICFARKIRGTSALNKMTEDEIALGGADNLTLEIQRSIDYYESQLKQPPIKNVFIAMASANVEGIIDAMNQGLPVKAKQLPIADLIGGDNVSLRYLPAVGAALGEMSNVEEVAE